MRKYSKILIIFLLLSSVIFPFIPIRANPVPSQAEVHFRVSVGTTVLDWDPVSHNPSTGNTYRDATLENMITIKDGWDGANLDELIPVLATSWVIEEWPSEMNSVGFKNSGGVKAIDWTLREGVTFHDGSLWNATVAKWNFDRIFIITGNLTGRGDTEMRDDYWININDLNPFFTTNWNLSWAIGKMGSYDGMVAPGTFLYEHVPLINNTQILDPGGSNGGGTLRIEFNDWTPFWVYDLFQCVPDGYMRMISMDAYKANYTDQSFHGYGPGSLVGTGPYIYGGHTATGPTTGGLLTKNENYWNRTGMEAMGWFDVTHIDFVVFPDDGKDVRNTALYTGNLDFATDVAGWEMDYDTVTSDPDLFYWESDVGYKYMRCVTFNNINETYWKTAFDSALWDGTDPMGNVGLGGIPRLFRKAISYAFDYDGFIQTAYNGRAFRANSFLGANSTYANESIPMPYLNLTIAREAMLAQFPNETAANGLYSNNTDDDALWQSVATGSTPIWKLNFYWDIEPDHLIQKDYLVTALKNIGCSYWEDFPDDVLPDNEFQDTFEAFSGNLFPYFLYEASIGVDWTHFDNYGVHPFLYAYHRNIGDWSFEMGWNAAHMYLDNVTFWIEEFYYANFTRQQEIFDKVAWTLQTYQYPWMWIGETMTGAAWRVEWDIDYDWYGSIIPFIRIKYVGKEEGVPEIPGYSVIIFLSISLVAMLGVIYIMMRKKQLK